MTKPKNDVDEVIWEKIQTHGDDAPCSRRGASVTMVGEHKCIVFGGEDNDRRFLNDVWILDMTSFVWREVKAPGGHPPEPRAEHSAAMWGPDTLLVFGGTGKSTRCFNSLHALDLAHQKWMDVKPTGSTPPPRAGHAGILLKDGRYWCHVGGGNNERGLNECSVLDLEEMTWISRPDALEAPPVVGEGMTLCVLSTQDGREDVVIAFGGYNGATQNETQLLRVPRDFPEHVLVERTATPAVRAEVVTEGNAELRKENAEIASSTRERVSSSSFETISDAPLAASKSNAELRKENVELHRALHRARADAKIIADAHEKLRVKCDDYERTAREDAQKITELTAKLRTFQTSASDELVRSRAA